MPATATAPETLQKELDKASPNTIADALQKVKLGTMLAPLKRTFSGLSASATMNLTALDAAGETVGAGNPKRQASLVIDTLRVVAGTAAAGVRKVGDSGATPDANVATISDDGKTVTFEDVVTGFVISYIPRPAADMTASFARL